MLLSLRLHEISLFPLLCWPFVLRSIIELWLGRNLIQPTQRSHSLQEWGPAQTSTPSGPVQAYEQSGVGHLRCCPLEASTAAYIIYRAIISSPSRADIHEHTWLLRAIHLQACPREESGPAQASTAPVLHPTHAVRSASTSGLEQASTQE